MKVYVDQDLCISCGACMSICPEVFDWNDDGKAMAKVDVVDAKLKDESHEAVESCPTEAIKEEAPVATKQTDIARKG